MDRNPCTYDVSHGAIVEAFVPLKVDVSRTTDKGEAQKQRFEAPNLPAVRLVDAERTVIGQIDNEVAPAEAVPIIRSASAHLRRLAKHGGHDSQSTHALGGRQKGGLAGSVSAPPLLPEDQRPPNS